jgi:hypothetical protein
MAKADEEQHQESEHGLTPASILCNSIIGKGVSLRVGDKQRADVLMGHQLPPPDCVRSAEKTSPIGSAGRVAFHASIFLSNCFTTSSSSSFKSIFS